MIEDVLTNIEDPEEVPEENHVSDSDHIENETIEEEIQEQLLEDPVVSGNEVYQQEVLNLLSEMKGDLEDVKRSNDRLLQESLNTRISDSVSNNNVSNNQYEYLSSNIITKPINEYTVSEALLLTEVVCIFAVIIFLTIRKAVYKCCTRSKQFKTEKIIYI